MICSCSPPFKFFYPPPDGAIAECHISNRVFSDFLRTYYCDFLNNVYRYGREVCSIVVICSGVAGHRPAGIAVLQRRHCFCF